MNHRHIQASLTLTAERIHALQNQLVGLRLDNKMYYMAATPDTLAGSNAYIELNKIRNRIRTTRTQLRKWRGVHEALKAALADAQDQDGWTRVPSLGVLDRIRDGGDYPSGDGT